MNRGLTEDEAQRGVQPPLLSADEWRAMWEAVEADTDRVFRRRWERVFGAHGNAPRQRER